jgi:hypothetical protein
MHTLALLCGAWIHVVGDVALLAVGTVIAYGPSGYMYDEHFEYPSRSAAAFALLPIPLGLSVGGLIVVQWGLWGYSG